MKINSERISAISGVIATIVAILGFGFYLLDRNPKPVGPVAMPLQYSVAQSVQVMSMPNAVAAGVAVDEAPNFLGKVPRSTHDSDDITPSKISMDVAESDLSVLHITGAGAKVEIKESGVKHKYVGGEVSSPGSRSVVYLPLGQSLLIDISGAGVAVRVDERLIPYIQVNDRSAGSLVAPF